MRLVGLTMCRFSFALVPASLALLGAAPAEASNLCQPKTGLHQHLPQYHIIAPLQPGRNGTQWPSGLNDVNGLLQVPTARTHIDTRLYISSSTRSPRPPARRALDVMSNSSGCGLDTSLVQRALASVSPMRRRPDGGVLRGRAPRPGGAESPVG